MYIHMYTYLCTPQRESQADTNKTVLPREKVTGITRLLFHFQLLANEYLCDCTDLSEDTGVRDFDPHGSKKAVI